MQERDRIAKRFKDGLITLEQCLAEFSKSGVKSAEEMAALLGMSPMEIVRTIGIEKLLGDKDLMRDVRRELAAKRAAKFLVN